MAKTIFDHLKGITKEKVKWNSLDDADKKSWDDYMITRWLSMSPDYIRYINDLQIVRNSGIRSEDYYNMLFYSLPKKFNYVKYIKKSRIFEDKKELIDFFSNAYSVSKRECLDYIELFHILDMKNEFDLLLQTHGIQAEDKEKLRKEMFDGK